LKPWQIFLGVKWLEVCFHLQPRKLLAMLTMPDRDLRRQTLWTLFHTGMVWLAEVGEFVFSTSFARQPRTLRETMRRQRGKDRENSERSRSLAFQVPL